MTDYDLKVKELLAVARQLATATTQFEKVQLLNRAGQLRAEVETLQTTKELFIAVT